MDDLTPDQKHLLERRLSLFEPFLAERMDVVSEFFEQIGAEQPEEVVANPEGYLSFLEQFLNAQDVSSFDSQDKSYLRARLIYFVGELLIQRYGGHWIVHENPDSPQFARYVVGCFPNQKRNLTADPATVAEAYLAGTTSGGLSKHLQAVERELATYTDVRFGGTGNACHAKSSDE